MFLKCETMTCMLAFKLCKLCTELYHSLTIGKKNATLHLMHRRKKNSSCLSIATLAGLPTCCGSYKFSLPTKSFLFRSGSRLNACLNVDPTQYDSLIEVILWDRWIHLNGPHHPKCQLLQAHTRLLSSFPYIRQVLASKYIISITFHFTLFW
jgi:hypothetical protein